MKVKSLSLCSILFSSVTFQAFAAPDALQGKLLGHDGKPMKAAQIEVAPLGAYGTKDKRYIATNSDGSYSLDLDKGQQYRLSYSGVGHSAMSLVVDYQGQKDLGLDVHLDPRAYLQNPETVTLIIFNDEDSGKKAYETFSIKPDEKGRYSLDIDREKGAIEYILMGLTKQRSFATDLYSEGYTKGPYSYLVSTVQHKGGN